MRPWEKYAAASASEVALSPTGASPTGERVSLRERIVLAPSAESVAGIVAAPRVALVDALQLDNELVELVKTTFSESLSALSNHLGDLTGPPGEETVDSEGGDLNESAETTTPNNKSRAGAAAALLSFASQMAAFVQDRVRLLPNVIRTIPTLYDAEFDALLKYILIGVPLLRSAATVGDQLQNLVLRDERKHSGKNNLLHVTAKASTSQRYLLVCSFVLVPYVWTKMTRYIESHNWISGRSAVTGGGDDETMLSNIRILNSIRSKINENLTNERKKILAIAARRIETLLQSLSLVHFLVFLVDGKYRTISERLLRVRLVLRQREVDHSISFEFMNRQIVWNALTDFIMFVLPFIDMPRLRRNVNNVLHTIPQASSSVVNQISDTLGLQLMGNTKSNGGADGSSSKINLYQKILDIDSKDKYPKICALCLERNLQNERVVDALKSHYVEEVDREDNSTYSSKSMLDVNTELEPTESAEETLSKNISAMKREDAIKEVTALSPYKGLGTKCGHIFCYYCIKQEIMSDNGYACPACSNQVGPKIVPVWYNHK